MKLANDSSTIGRESASAAPRLPVVEDDPDDLAKAMLAMAK